MNDNEIGRAIGEQIKITGSVAIYNAIKDSFNRPPHLYFMKEQFDLYKWRKEFFLKHFPEGSLETDCNFGCGKLGFSSDVHKMAAIHYNITENFEEVLKFALGDSKPVFPTVLHFPTDYFSDWFHNKFEWDTNDEKDVLKKLSTVDFSTGVHILCVLYSSSPPSLLQISMKKILKLNQSVEKAPVELQV